MKIKHEIVDPNQKRSLLVSRQLSEDFEVKFLDDNEGGNLPLPYIEAYEEGDLIYGLNSGRTLYLEAIMQMHNIKDFPRVLMVDDMNSQFLGTNAPATSNQRKLGQAGCGLQYIEKPETTEATALFHALLRDTVKKKWRPQKNQGADKVNHRLKSASKAGILFTTMVEGRVGDWKKKRNRIHFILDKIDMETVTKKLDPIMGGPEDSDNKSVTGCELRWLYRQRHNSHLMAKVVFWEENKMLNHAPWDDHRWKELWNDYRNLSTTLRQSIH